jgi:glyoxylase-like metal-dependent hydrolase (beta-lactamase superfamily II)
MIARSPRVIAVGVGLVAFTLSAFAQPANPVVREGVTEKISAHVHVIPDASVSLVPNVGIIVGTRGTFVVDTGLGRRNGEAVVREVAKVSQGPELWLGTTHFHPEHDLGAMAFPAHTKLLRSMDQQKDIDEFGLQLARTFAQRGPAVAELLKDAEFRKADTTFEREQVVDLGGVKVRVMAMGANHTRGDTVFLVEPDGILFSGDVVMKPLPSFASPYSTIAHWRGSLDALEKLAPKKIVPSHGPIGDGTALVAGYREYFTTVQARVADLKKAGKSLEETTAALAAEFATKYPDRQRLGGAIRAAFNEAK